MLSKTSTLPVVQHDNLSLLLSCLSLSSDQQTLNHIKDLEHIDWPALIQLAKKHKVGPLFYHRLSQLGLKVAPASLHEDFYRYSQAMAGRNLFVTFELVRLLSLMAAKGIDTLPYKGPVLAQTLYKTLNLRVFSDLDIIVQPEDMYAVEALLVAEGYRPYYGKKSKEELTAHMQSAAEHTYDFYHDHKQVFIEVHWRFWPTTFSSVNPKAIWHRRKTATLAGKPVANLIIEDYLIILCMHGSRHMWQRLSWLCDIAMLLHNYPELDWSQAIQQANQWGVRRMVYLGLYLAHAWLKAPLPAPILQQLSADPKLPTLATQVETQVFQEGQHPKTFMGTTQYQIHVRERWQDKASYTAAFVGWVLKGCPHTTD